MRSGRIAAAAMAGATLVSGCTAPSNDSALLDADDAALVAQGETLYGRHCAVCHGANLEGQPNWRERDANGLLPAPPHDATGHTWHHPADILFQITKYGLQDFAGPDYRTSMIAYEAVPSDAEIVAILSYIKSTWPADIRARQSGLNRGD